ncbi:uridine kinase [Dactylosporangium sp. NPDC051541]|uniref:uridine kinase n=1 Tax=Dactylosporangium sp. NPDC051541 TaxID=3363977 RepID=UPI003797F117
MRLHPGEPEATGWRAMSVPDVIGRLRAAAPDVRERPLVVAIDGRGGAGKTTLAQWLRAAVPGSAVVHTDDVAWAHACFDWGALLAGHVLGPLHRGEAVDYRPDAWRVHGRAGSITVPAGADTVWVEGTGIIRRELARSLAASIWLQGDLDVQDRLLLARDGDSPGHLAQVESWMREELPFLLQERPWAHATMIVAGPPPAGSEPGDGLLVADPVRS